MTTLAKMTSESSFIPERLDPVEDRGAVLRLTQRVFGAAMIVAAFGMWFFPSIGWGVDVLMIKMIMSVSSILIGFGLMLSLETPETSDLETVRVPD